MIERQVEVQTPDGSMTTFLFHPEEEGPFPVVLYVMDAPSIRIQLKDMASRLATVGYYVMLPYLFYRGGPFREFGMTDEDMHARRDLMRTVSRDGIVRDAQALLAYAAEDPNARGGNVGAVGFCMSGRLVLALAQRMPERSAAAAALHGGGYDVADRDDSPHKAFDRIRGEVYFGWADQDPGAPREHIPIVEKALIGAGVRHRIDFMEGALHGFAPRGPRYHRAASEKHWERVLAMFRRNL